MAVETIPVATARQICGKLYSAANMLRGMWAVAAFTETENDYEAMISVIPGLAERAHLILDACIQKMEGGGGLGNFNDNDWDEGIESAEECEGGAV